MLRINFTDKELICLLPGQPVLEFPIDPNASRYYFDRVWGVLSVLHTNDFLANDIWSAIEPTLRTTNYVELVTLNKELCLYTAPNIKKVERHAESANAEGDKLEVALTDPAGIHVGVKVTGIRGGIISVSIQAGNLIFSSSTDGQVAIPAIKKSLAK